MASSKEHNRAYMTKYRAEHRQAVNRNARKSYYKNRDKTLAKLAVVYKDERDWLNERKAKPCLDCGRSYPPFVMEFDHVRGKKKNVIGRMLGSQMKRSTIEAEIEKCDLVCANCHRQRTHDRGQWGGNSKKPSPFETRDDS